MARNPRPWLAPPPLPHESAPLYSFIRFGASCAYGYRLPCDGTNFPNYLSGDDSSSASPRDDFLSAATSNFTLIYSRFVFLCLPCATARLCHSIGGAEADIWGLRSPSSRLFSLFSWTWFPEWPKSSQPWLVYTGCCTPVNQIRPNWLIAHTSVFSHPLHEFRRPFSYLLHESWSLIPRSSWLNMKPGCSWSRHQHQGYLENINQVGKAWIQQNDKISTMARLYRETPENILK